MKILIADDHVLFRQGLKQILAEEFPRVVFGEASNTRELRQSVQNQAWDVVLLDISMPGRNGLEVLKEIKQSQPRLPVLVLSMHPEDQFALRAFKAGAAGYMTKESAADALVKAIQGVVGGGTYVSTAFAPRLAQQIGGHVDKPAHQTLSDRELEVMLLIARGKRIKDIAGELSLSIKTISTHRQHILLKLNFSNNAEIIRYALKNRLVD